jgi:hypothetical protein
MNFFIGLPPMTLLLFMSYLAMYETHYFFEVVGVCVVVFVSAWLGEVLWQKVDPADE